MPVTLLAWRGNFQGLEGKQMVKKAELSGLELFKRTNRKVSKDLLLEHIYELAKEVQRLSKLPNEHLVRMIQADLKISSRIAESVKMAKTESSIKMNDSRHAENRDLKREAIEWYLSNKYTHPKIDVKKGELLKNTAADLIAGKIIPSKRSTVRGWLTGI